VWLGSPEPAPELALEPEPSASSAKRRRAPRPIVVPPDLHVRWAVDVPLVVVPGAIWLGTELALDRVVPSEPRWTKVTPGDLAIRDAATWRSPKSARVLSNAFTWGVIPLLGLGLTLADVGRTRQWRWLPEDLVIAGEAVAVAGLISQTIKIGAARGRPYTYEAYAEPSEAPIDERLVSDPDGFTSFPSGHATLAFAFVSSLATVATMRKRKLAPVLWGLGIPSAAVVAYARVAGYRHWFSDVVVGSTIGMVIGAGLPVLLHHPRFGLLGRMTKRARDGSGQAQIELQVIPTATGASVIGRF
jgi:membrane-associated phospholipid phosphatase